MIKIVEDGKVKSLYDMPHEFIRVVAKLDNELESRGLELDKITITTDDDGEKDCEINWKCDLRYFFR